MIVKFTFHLKSGKVFEDVAECNEDEFKSVVYTARKSFQEGLIGVISLGSSLINLSECAVVDWEVLDEQKTEKSEGN